MGNGKEITALLISPDRKLAEQFTNSLATNRIFQLVGEIKTYPALQTIEMRLRQLRPDVVLLDVVTNLDTACELIRYLTELKPPVHVVGLHRFNDSEAVLRTLRVGATEFLYAPFDVSIQEAALQRILRLIEPDTTADREMGKVIVFTSTKPGSGASTLAVQTAFALKRRSGKRVLLVDFDLMGGTVGFYLRLDQSYSLVDVLQSGEKMDSTQWSQMTVSSGGIEVLPSPDLPYADAVDPARLHDVLQYARMLYDWVIVDLPSVFHRVSLLMLSESDRAFLVSTSELASLHLARKAVKLLTHLGFDSKRYQLLVNRIDKRDGLNGSDLNKLFDCEVDMSLPNDYFTLHRVITLGEPLQGDTDLGRAVEGLAAKLCGPVPEERKGRSGLMSARPAFSHS